MAIATVTIVPGTEILIGEGVNNPFRCVVRFPDQSIKAAVVKAMAPQAVAAEVFCACLLRGWGLSVPEPAIVTGPPMAFASMETGYPNLKQRLGWTDRMPPLLQQRIVAQGARIVAGLQDTPRALAADEAIDNRDRNLGNILWDGATVSWIDHDRALGVVPAEDANRLAQFVIMGATDFAPIQRAAVAIALMLGPQAVAEAEDECEGLAVSSFANLVAGRLGPLATRVLNRFPQPADLFNQIPVPK